MTDLRHTLRREDGSAAVELGLLLPVLLAAALIFTPVVTRLGDSTRTDDALGQAIRYATKASANAIEASADGHCPAPRRRRSAVEVADFLDAASGGLVPADLVSVSVQQPNGAPDVVHPCQAIPGSVVTITAVVGLDDDVIDDLSAAARQVLTGGGQVPGLPATRTITAVGVLE